MTAPDIDEDRLTQAELHRRAMHRAVDEIIRVWPHAQVDADARGFPSGGGGETGRSAKGDHSDPTGRIAMTPGKAVAWLADLHDVVLEVAGGEPAAWDNHGLVAKILHNAVEALAGAWPALGDRRDALYRLADAGSKWWPPPPKKGDTVRGVTVGQRGNQVEDCGLCGEPAPGGKNDAGQLLVRRIDGVPYHNIAVTKQGACYWLVWRQRRRTA
jgi:hypothetical protein